MQSTHCPLCETNSHDREIYAANFRPADLNPEVFSARRLPDRLHYRMVRCGECGVLRSDPILSENELAALYGESEFTYADEAEYTRKTYGKYLQRALRWVRDRGKLLEIGTPQEVVAHRHLRLGVFQISDAVAAANLLRGDADVDEVAHFGHELRVTTRRDVDPIALVRRRLGGGGLTVDSALEDRVSVEDAFVAMVHDDRREAP